MRHFNVFFNIWHSPTKPTIINLVKRFRGQGSVAGRSQPGRGLLVRTPENTENVRRSIEDNPTTSTRRSSQELGASLRSLQRIQRGLNMYPYKVQLVQSIQPLDLQQRLNYAIRSQEILRININFIHNLIMGDEAHFPKIHVTFMQVNCTHVRLQYDVV